MRLMPWLLVLAASTVTAQETCAPESTVQFDPASWEKRMRAATTCAQVSAGLDSVGLQQFRCEGSAADGTVEDLGKRPVKVVVARAFRARLSADGRDVRVLDVVTNGDPTEPALGPIQRSSIFVAVGPGTWCRLELPELNRGPDDFCTSTVFAFESLVARGRDALHVTDHERGCQVIGAYRAHVTTQTWWEVRGFRLVPLLSIETSSSFDLHDGQSDSTVQKLTWSGPFPRVATISTTNAWCRLTVEERENLGSTPAECHPGSSLRVEAWQFDDAQSRYVLAKTLREEHSDAGSE